MRFYDLLAAAVALSIASVLLALFFYRMGAPMAAVFELSVGAGLVTVLFITAISLVSKARETKPEKRGGLARLTTFLYFCVVGSVFAYAACSPEQSSGDQACRGDRRDGGDSLGA